MPGRAGSASREGTRPAQPVLPVRGRSQPPWHHCAESQQEAQAGLESASEHLLQRCFNVALTWEPRKEEQESQSAHCSPAGRRLSQHIALCPGGILKQDLLVLPWFPSHPQSASKSSESRSLLVGKHSPARSPTWPSGPKSPPQEAPPTSAGRKGAFPGPQRAFLECVLPLQQKDACVKPGWLAQDSTWNVGKYFCSRLCRG